LIQEGKKKGTRGGREKKEEKGGEKKEDMQVVERLSSYLSINLPHHLKRG